MRFRGRLATLVGDQWFEVEAQTVDEAVLRCRAAAEGAGLRAPSLLEIRAVVDQGERARIAAAIDSAVRSLETESNGCDCWERFPGLAHEVARGGFAQAGLVADSGMEVRRAMAVKRPGRATRGWLVWDIARCVGVASREERTDLAEHLTEIGLPLVAMDGELMPRGAAAEVVVALQRVLLAGEHSDEMRAELTAASDRACAVELARVEQERDG